MERASGIQVGSTASGGSKLVTGGGRDQRSSTPEIGKDISEVGMPGNAVETRNIQRELVISSPWTLSARDARLKILFKQGMQVEKREELASYMCWLQLARVAIWILLSFSYMYPSSLRPTCCTSSNNQVPHFHSPDFREPRVRFGRFGFHSSNGRLGTKQEHRRQQVRG